MSLGVIRESSFNMTRGGDEDIEGGLRKFLDTRKGGSEKIRRGSANLYSLKPTGGGAAKISSFEFQYLHPPLVILNELSLIYLFLYPYSDRMIR